MAPEWMDKPGLSFKLLAVLVGTRVIWMVDHSIMIATQAIAPLDTASQGRIRKDAYV